MKNFKILTLIIFFFLTFTNLAFPQDKIAIIDLDILLEKTNYGKKIIVDLNSLNEQNVKSLKKIETEIKLNQDDILLQGDDLHLLIDQPVKVLLRSIDVLHNFYVPQFRGKMDMVPQLNFFINLS